MTPVATDDQAWLASLSDDELVELVKFRNVAESCWKVPSKGEGYDPFMLRPAQVLLDNDYERQMDTRGYVRQNVLKCRQAGISTYYTRRALKFVWDHEASAAISIAHEKDLPTEWLEDCKRHIEQTPAMFRSEPVPAKGLRLAFSNGSKYGIGSVQGGFPGMGRTLPFQHKSELGRWDKTGIGQDPNRVLIPVSPCMPSGDNIYGTVDIHESTGVMVGDWWYNTWQAGKLADNDFVNLFIPWYLVPEYRSVERSSDVISLSDYEQQTAREAKATCDLDLSHAQIAWYRHELRQTPFFGNEPEFRAEFPANEDEAFYAAGQAQYTQEMVANARETQRDPIWMGDVVPDPETNDPGRARFVPNPGGAVSVWEWPDRKYHFALGADCMWGKRSKGTDFDCLHVERLELDENGCGPLYAKVRGKWPLSHWGWILMAMGHKFNTCPVAPEITGQETQEGKGVMAVLLGETSEYRYPNIWIRTGKTTLRPRVEDYGWNTDYHTKRLLLAMSQTASLEKLLDWCDEGAILQMGRIICTETGALEAPTGMNDDDWMSRIITAEVARRERPKTDLWREPVARAMPMRTPEQRARESDEMFLREAYGDEDNDGVETY